MTSFIGLLCFLFVFSAVIALALLLLVRKSNRESPVTRKIAQIERDYPDEVRAWGGRRALQDPATVRAIIAKLESNS